MPRCAAGLIGKAAPIPRLAAALTLQIALCTLERAARRRGACGPCGQTDAHGLWLQVLKKLRPTNSAPHLPTLRLGSLFGITKIFNLSNLAFDWLIKAAPWLLGQIIRLTRVDIPKGSRVRARAAIKSGVGADAGLCLGWTDTKGYRMVGLQGQVGLIAKLGFNLLAGLHQDRQRVKAIIGYSNVAVELEFTLPHEAEEKDGGVGESEAHAQMELEREEADAAAAARRGGAAAVEAAPSLGAALGDRRRHWSASWTLLLTALVVGVSMGCV